MVLPQTQISFWVSGVTLTVPPVVGVLCRHRGFEQCGTTAGTEDRSGAANTTFVLPNTIQALFLDTYHAFYAFDFSEKLSFGLFELSFLQNN